MSIFSSSIGGSCVAPIESVASSYVSATYSTLSWVSTFDELAAGSCVTVVSSKMNYVTKSWMLCISVPEGEEDSDSGFG